MFYLLFAVAFTMLAFMAPKFALFLAILILPLGFATRVVCGLCSTRISLFDAYRAVVAACVVAAVCSLFTTLQLAMIVDSGATGMGFGFSFVLIPVSFYITMYLMLGVGWWVSLLACVACYFFWPVSIYIFRALIF